jgi:hypothetical protein
MAIEGDFVEYTGSVMSIDLSGQGKDETGYAVVKMLHGNMFVRRCGGLRGGYDERTLRKLVEIAKEEQVNEIIVESNFGGGMFNSLLTPILGKEYPCTLSEVRHNTQKEKRIIDVLEPALNQHRLIMDKKLIQDDYKSTQNLPPEQALRYQLMYQLTRLTADRGSLANDDRLDALAMAVQFWVAQVAQDNERQIDTRRTELLAREVDNMRDKTSLGLAVMMSKQSTSGNSWL